MTPKNDDLQNRTLTIKKTLNAPIDLVWKAWTEPDHIAKWWVPEGMPFEVIEYNFSVGGKWKYQMMMPDCQPFISEGTFKEIEEKKRIVSSADFKPMTEDVELHILFESKGDQTFLEFSVVHTSQEYCKQQEEMGFYNGWGSVMERLDSFLEEKLNQ